MKRFVFATTLAGICFVSQANCLACFVVSPDFPEAYDKARAVFIGEVTEIKKPIFSDPKASLADRLYRVTFKVEYSWKGAGFQEFGAPGVVVLSDQGMDGSCFSWGSFREGGKYLVYAEATTENELIVRLGNRTALLFKSSEDLKELQRMSNPFYRFSFKRRDA
jgi:hypothetical protein